MNLTTTPGLPDRDNPGLTPGFSDPVHHAQACFRSILHAMSSPGTPIELHMDLCPPPPFSPASAAVLLTLTDNTTRISVQSATPASRQWVAFHTGAIDSPAETADFVFATLRPQLATLKAGSDLLPEQGATLILDLPELGQGRHYRLTGPGIESETILLAPLDAHFASEWHACRQWAPRGVDMLLCAGRHIIGLPRSVCMEEL